MATDCASLVYRTVPFAFPGLMVSSLSGRPARFSFECIPLKIGQAGAKRFPRRRRSHRFP